MQVLSGKGGRRAAALAPVGLLVGYGLGLWANQSSTGTLSSLADILGPLGKLWTNALQMAVIPMVACLLIAGIGGMDRKAGFGRWGWISICVFLAILVLGALFSYGMTTALLPALDLTRVDASSLAPIDAPAAKALSFGEWIEGLLPANLVQAAAGGEMLAISLGSILFALAVRQLPENPRDRVVSLFAAMRDAVMTYVGWVLLAMPFAAFALAFGFAATAGWDAAQATLQFVLLSAGVLLAATLLLYPLAILVGRVSPAQFASGAFPAQTVAVGTRSSLAAAPTLVAGVDRAGLPAPAGEIVVPLAASLFKPNRTVSSTTKLLFVAALCGVTLSPAAIVSFVATVLLLSISSPGIPSMGTRVTFGAYVAAGLPPAAVMLFEAVDPIIDIFKTVYNVTGSFASAAIVSRFAERNLPAAALPEPVSA